MPDPTTPEREGRETRFRMLDSTGGASAYSHPHGMVRVELWCTDRTAGEDPIYVVMTPGQAMGLCSNLASSAAVTLREALKP